MPWHDSTMIVAGPVGGALAELGNERWQRATKKGLRELHGKGENWPDDLEPDFEGVDVAISRTRAAYAEWDEIREIEQLYQIGRAHVCTPVTNAHLVCRLL